MKPVRPGDRGPAVEDIQRRLLTLGYDLGRTGVDGVFLGATAEAVLAFQTQHDLEEDGLVGESTWSTLVDASFSLGDRMLYLRLPHFHGHDVTVLQQALNALGFTVGEIDGIFGAFTERALRAPARLSGMPRYLWATFGEIGALRQHTLRLVCDGETVHDGATLFAAVLNTRSYGSGMPAVPHARIDDGRLDLLVAGRFGRVGTLAMLPLLLAGVHLHHPRVKTRPFSVLRVESEALLPLAADGELLPAARTLEVRVLPGALSVVARTAG